MSETAPRPQKVTLACLAAGAGSLIVLLSFSTILADWVSPEVREQAERVLSEPPLADSGITIEQLLEGMRIMMMIGAAVSVAVIILAIYTARRHRGARIVLTVTSVAAGIVFLPSGFTGVLPAAMAIASAVLLWSRDANAWFNPEKAARAEAARADAERAAAPRPPDTPSPHDPAPEPGPVTGPRAADVPFGSGQSGPQPAVPGAPPAYAQRPHPPAARVPRKGMPATVLGAILTASIMSGIVAVVSGIILAGYASSPTDLGNELLSYPAVEDNPQMDSLNWAAEDLGRAVVYTMAALLVLSLAAIGAALWMLRRSNAARIILVVLSGLTIALSAVATLAGIPWIGAAVAVIVLVFRPSANAYFRPVRSHPGTRQ